MSHPLQHQIADVGIELPQVQRCIPDRFNVRVLQQILRCGFPEAALRPYPVGDRLPHFGKAVREVPLGLFEVASSSAFENAAHIPVKRSENLDQLQSSCRETHRARQLQDFARQAGWSEMQVNVNSMRFRGGYVTALSVPGWA